MALEDIRAYRLDAVIPNLKAAIYLLNLYTFTLAKYRLVEVLQKHIVERSHIRNCAVVLLHQLLDTETLIVILVAEKFREFPLLIKQ